MKKIALLFAIISSLLVSSVFATWNFLALKELDSSDDVSIAVDYDFNDIYSVTYTGIENSDSLPDLVMENTNLEVNGLNYYYIKSIIMNDNLLINNTDYNVSNGKLTIYNTNGDIQVSATKPVTNGLVSYSSYYDRSDLQFGDYSVSNASSFYQGNDGNLKYDVENGAIFNSTYPVLVHPEITTLNITNEFTINVTLKGDPEQYGDDSYPATIAAIQNPQTKGYLLWIGFYKGFIHIYAYRSSTSIKNASYVYKYDADRNLLEKGFLSIKISDYVGVTQKVNLQVTAKGGDYASLYVNGSLLNHKGVQAKFLTETNSVNYTQMCIGDLSLARNLKFTGTIYDVHLYNRKLTEVEILQNYSFANSVWKIK